MTDLRRQAEECREHARQDRLRSDPYGRVSAEAWERLAKTLDLMASLDEEDATRRQHMGLDRCPCGAEPDARPGRPKGLCRVCAWQQQQAREKEKP